MLYYKGSLATHRLDSKGNGSRRWPAGDARSASSRRDRKRAPAPEGDATAAPPFEGDATAAPAFEAATALAAAAAAAVWSTALAAAAVWSTALAAAAWSRGRPRAYIWRASARVKLAAWARTAVDLVVGVVVVG